MKILLIGGTRFQGKYLQKYLFKIESNITVFHRGIHKLGQNNFNVNEIIGDRTNTEDLNKLCDDDWDCVIDTCGYIPRIVEKSCNLLKKRAQQYCFISTTSVYKNNNGMINNEMSPTHQLSDPENEKFNLDRYGGLKVICEKIVKRYFPNNHLIIRPSAIIGPEDHTERCVFWIRKMKSMKNLFPLIGIPDRKIQLIDVNDLCSFISQLIAKKYSGTVNVAGDKMTFLGFLNELSELLQLSFDFVPIDRSTLKKINLTEEDFPYCYGNLIENYDNEKAKKLGLVLSDLSNSLKCINKWDLNRNNKLKWENNFNNLIKLLV